MNPNDNLSKVQAGIWLGLGLLLVVFFFLPLYSSGLYDLNGIDTVDFVRDMPSDKLARYDAFTGVLMLGVPVLAMVIGFLAMVFGAAGLVSGNLGKGWWLTGLALMNLLMGIICVVKLDAQARGFFAVLLPKAGTGFYLLMFLHLCLAAAGPLLGAMRKPQQ